MVGEKIRETNVSSSHKFQIYNTMPLYHIHSLSACVTIYKMARMKVNHFSKLK